MGYLEEVKMQIAKQIKEEKKKSVRKLKARLAVELVRDEKKRLAKLKFI